MKVPTLLKKKHRLHATNFFDLKSSEKKKIIGKAVEESTKHQIDVLKEGGFAFSSVKRAK